MKRIIITALSALLTLPGMAQSMSADEAAWIETINVFAATEGKSIRIPLSVGVIVDSRNGDNPIGANMRGDECVIVLAVRNNSRSRSLQRLGPSSEVARLATVAHEFGHCLHRFGVRHGERLPALGGDESEPLADAFALAWIAKNRPQDFDAAVSFFKALRKTESIAIYDKCLAAVNTMASRLKEVQSNDNTLLFAAAILNGE